MDMMAVLSLLAPVAAAVTPMLMNRVTPIFDRIFRHASSTVTGAVGTGTLGAVFAAFPCLGDAGNWQKAAIALVPLVLGALSAPKPSPPPLGR